MARLDVRDDDELGPLDNWEPLAKPMTRAMLDGTGCANPECQCKSEAGTYPIVFAQKCHPGTGTDVFYFDGVATLRCHECKDHVAQFEVAK